MIRKIDKSKDLILDILKWIVFTVLALTTLAFFIFHGVVAYNFAKTSRKFMDRIPEKTEKPLGENLKSWLSGKGVGKDGIE